MSDPAPDLAASPERIAERESEERLRLALDAGGLGTWDFDPVAGALTWDDRCRGLFGFEPAEFDGTYDAVVARIHPDDRTRATEGVRQAIRDGAVYEDEFRIVLPDGSIRWIAARGQTFEPVDGTRRMAGVCMDITERRRTDELRAEAFAREQQARIQLEAASRAKDEFLAVVSHELRTPLNSILGWVRLLRTGNLDDGTVTRAIETIERNVKSQAQLIEDLLDVSRIISGKLRVNTQPLAPATFVEAALDIVRPAAEAKEITLSIERPSSLPLVLGDPERLQQVVWNLLSNAVKFTSRGGRVDVRLAKIESSVEIAVADTGQGIPAGFLPYVFDPFRQADGAATRIHKGLGLGLAIVRHLVELHGGSVAVESEGAGLGAVFRVHLPVSVIRPSSGKREASTTYDSPVFGHLPVLAGVRILVVDDEPDTREVLGLSLERAGATVEIAASAAEARAALDTGEFDVLVSDIGMPDEDGYDLIRSIRARPLTNGGGIPAIALTAFARAEDRVQALAAGFEMHVAKPVEPLELAMTIKNLTSLAGRSTAP